MRPERLNPLFADISALPHIGPAAARALARLEIARVKDLLFHLPAGWRHTRRLESLASAPLGERVALPVRIMAMEAPRGRGPARVIADDAAGIGLVLAFFGPAGVHLARRFAPGTEVVVAGKLESWNGRYQISHPERVDGELAGAEPVYPLTEGLTSRRIAQMVASALDRVPPLDEWIEPSLLADRGWPAMDAALREAHQAPEANLARDRLAHDELLATRLAWLLVRQRRRRQRGKPLAADGRLTNALLHTLPWPLTAAQQRVTAEITADLASPHAMLRLLQGDVGAGKTLVALLALLVAVEAGVQGVLVAPTDLLARQHFATIIGLLDGLPVSVGFLSGREKGRQRDTTLAALAAGNIDILVGTHAVFMAGVSYHNLGVAVVDEQHRFGVAQRMMLAEKAEQPPHLLVMTATPIPRTLQLAHFGEMDVSRLDERPPGRQPIETLVVPLARLDTVIEALARHLESGAQAYWVCPLLDAGATDDAANDANNPTPAVIRADMLRQRFGDQVALVHGRLAGPARDAEMARFTSGAARLLVATTVIEVGVDVPNASLMLIESAERFGLAQLHQLRGRVGRGDRQSTCILLRAGELSAPARERLKMMRATDDGFAIAEADLKLRGPGEMLGTRQSGDEGFRLASDEQVARLMDAADADARLLLDRDGGLEGRRGAAARILLYLHEKDAAVGTLRGG